MRIIALYRAMKLARRKKRQFTPKGWTKDQLNFIEEHRIHWN